MTKAIRVEVFVENASGFVLYLPEQKLTKNKCVITFLEFWKTALLGHSTRTHTQPS
jgi:hypothetical protein